MECKEGYYLESKECKQWYLNYTNWMKSIECLEWYVKDVDLETFNCRNVTKVEICHSAQNGECIDSETIGCYKMINNICYETGIYNYIDFDNKIIDCDPSTPICKYQKEHEDKIEPYECSDDKTLYFENNKAKCLTTDSNCIQHTKGIKGNRECKECKNEW